MKLSVFLVTGLPRLNLRSRHILTTHIRLTNMCTHKNCTGERPGITRCSAQVLNAFGLETLSPICNAPVCPHQLPAPHRHTQACTDANSHSNTHRHAYLRTDTHRQGHTGIHTRAGRPLKPAPCKTRSPVRPVCFLNPLPLTQTRPLSFKIRIFFFSFSFLLL